MSAERAYLFRHALLREAAYQLQLPGDRARLHGLALAVLEALHGVPAAVPLDSGTYTPAATDAQAEDMAQHAHAASGDMETGALAAREQLYLCRAALFAEHDQRPSDALRLLRRAQEIEGSDVVPGYWVIQKLGANLRSCGQLANSAQELRRALEAARSAGIADGIVVCLCDLGMTLSSMGDSQEATHLLRRAREAAGPDTPLHVRCMILQQLAWLRHQGGDRAEAESLQHEALRMTQGAEGLARARAESNWGSFCVVVRDFDEGARALNSALAVFEPARKHSASGRALASLALIERERGNFERAEHYLRQALGYSRASGDRVHEAALLGNLAVLMEDLGRVGDAEALYRESVNMALEVGELRRAGSNWGNLANVLRESGRVVQAEEAFLQAIALLKRAGDEHTAAVHTGGYALVLENQGRLDEAEAAFGDALGMARKMGDGVNEAVVLNGLASLRQRQGRYAEADALCAQALPVAEAAQSAWTKGLVLSNRACVALHMHDLTRALALRAEMRAVLREVGMAALAEECEASIRKVAELEGLVLQ